MSIDEYKEDFKKGAQSNLEIAGEALNKQLYVDAFIHSFWTLENLLKAILVKSNKFVNRANGDRHHRCLGLFSKIQDHHLIPADVLDEVESHMMDLLTINVYSGGGHVDSPPHLSHKVINDIRYFDAASYIGLNDSRPKVQKAELIYRLLNPYT